MSLKLKSIVCIVFGLLSMSLNTSARKPNITVAMLIERSALLDMPFIINRTVGLIEMATKKAQEITQSSANLNFLLRYADVPKCVSLKWGALAAEVFYNNDVQAIIGPGCSNSVEVVARLTAAWNLPHITYVGTGEALGNKTEFSTLTRLSFNLNLYAKFYMEVFKAFSWTDIANIYDASLFLPTLVGTSLQRTFVEYSVNSKLLPFQSDAIDLKSELLRLLTEAKKISRIFVVSCNGDVFREMVLLGQHMGMEQGEYAFIFYISQPGSPIVGNFSWERGDDQDSEAKEAYQSVFLISPRRPVSEEFLEFEQRVIDLAQSLYSYTWKDPLGIYNIGHYDSFVLYAHALNDALAAGEDPRDGALMNKRLWNRTFPGIGGTVYVNENGDRDTDFSLLDLEPVSGKYRAVAQYLGYTSKFELLPDAPIHWPKNAGPPPNTPKCGFVGELCQTYSFPLYGTVIIAFVAAIIVILIGGVFIFRRMRAEAAIYNQWWRVKWQDINIQTKSTMLSTSSKAEEEIRSLATYAPAFQTVGVYKGVQVHIRKPKIKSLTIDRKLLMELKQMRDVTCPNLTRLIGLCPDTNNICIITEYCSRGNLQDILQNDSMQLDKHFRLSLINDIVQGMYYIHNSPIEVHGCLTSSSCVIDSRFVLKITGFGLGSINDAYLNTIDETCSNVWTNFVNQGLFWMAPEILRAYPPRMTSQHGDVYSFAIILYEMCTRHEPYTSEPWYISIEDTLKQVKAQRPNPRRPSFGSDNTYPELYKLAEECWREVPDDRPNFGEIRKKVHFLRRDNPHGDNVLDMLLHRMEQYANNLEGLVEERTNAFLEEKKKSEELLNQVLPKSVADQLKVGQMVTPEAFKTVTIYFSDIVGFTSLSAASTPFQVVDFLNDVYTCFDTIIENFEVYKVETIGDAYMVVSGLPVRNGNEHVRQIARMSLKILEQVQQFVIRHQPSTPLRARIGIHSGPVVAGVVGRKMPRYCLFGDTVNTASRMESNGLSMMIHISDSTRNLLEMFGNFVMEERGEIEIKGKGSMLTHWLVDEL